MVDILPALVVPRLQLVVVILLQISKLQPHTQIVAANGPTPPLALSRCIHNGPTLMPLSLYRLLPRQVLTAVGPPPAAAPPLLHMLPAAHSPHLLTLLYMVSA